MELSIILVNYNGLKYLPGCLDSIRRFSPTDSEVIMVDNGSRDGSADLVEGDYPWVRILRSDRNLGFAGGNNLAASHANGKFLLLLNTDTILQEPLVPALQWLDQNAEYGLLSIGMMDGQGILRACTGHFPSPLQLTFFRRMLISPDHYKQAAEVDWVQGSFLLIRKHLWQDLKGLDDRYFMYVEDVDLCRRAYDLGQKCAFLPHMRYTHFGGFSPLRFPSQVANLALYVDLHMKGLPRIVSRTVLLLGCVARVLWYGIPALVVRDEKSLALEQACWRALCSLRLRPGSLEITECGVRF